MATPTPKKVHSLLPREWRIAPSEGLEHDDPSYWLGGKESLTDDVGLGMARWATMTRRTIEFEQPVFEEVENVVQRLVDVTRGFTVDDIALEPPPWRVATGSELRSEFQTLAERWERETLFESLPYRRAMHPAYQRIIGMGDPAVSLILEQLRVQPDDWFWALSAITGEDPAQGTDDFDSAVSAWLEWGVQKGLTA